MLNQLPERFLVERRLGVFAKTHFALCPVLFDEALNYFVGAPCGFRLDLLVLGDRVQRDRLRGRFHP